MKDWYVFFDMDGVLADFDRGIIELCKGTPRDQGIENPAADEIMWKGVKGVEHFYDLLEFMPDAEEMFKLIDGSPNCHCEILTGIPKERRGIVTAGEDKTNWVRRKLSTDIPVNIVYKEQKKERCKGKNYILIDDYPRNIKEWEAAGGTGILFKDAKKTIETLREMGVL